MRKLLTLLTILTVAVFMAPRDGNAVAVGPGSTSGFVNFDLGDTTVTFDGAADSVLNLTVGSGYALNISIQDCCISGDVFDLIIDGGVVAWDSETFPGGLFNGSIMGLVLSAGAHTLDFGIRSYCCGTAEGGYAEYSITSVSAIPLPAALPLLLAGLGGLGALSLRRKKA